jgi:class 3 adenylate cyclase
MGREGVQEVRCVVPAQPGDVFGDVHGAALTRATSSRLETRVLHVHMRQAGWFAQRVADARLADGLATSLNQATRLDAGRILTTVLMTDIVGSTDTVAKLGDQRWRDLLAAHYADCRASVRRSGGELLNTTGDGILAIFNAPARAIRAAIAIQAGARASGVGLRAGVHTGECERLWDGLAGLAVHIAARICALAAAHEVMTTGIVRDLVTDSTLAFAPRGCHVLRGVPGNSTVFSAVDFAQVEPAPRSVRRRML